MITNFHLPYSTQLMMVAAFAGYDAADGAPTTVAKKEKYRFGTYGDAMLILLIDVRNRRPGIAANGAKN